MTDRKLSAQEAAFCRAYVMECDRDAKAAAIKADYSPNGAAVAGHRLLQRPHVKAEIGRLEAEALKRTGLVSSILTAANHGADRTEPASPGSIADQIRNETDADTIAVLARAYILAGLKENFDICLGRKKRTLIKFKKVKDQDGKPVETAVEIQVFDPNPSAANAAAVILLAAPEIGGGKVDAPGDDKNASIREALKAFK